MINSGNRKMRDCDEMVNRFAEISRINKETRKW